MVDQEEEGNYRAGIVVVNYTPIVPRQVGSALGRLRE